MRLEIRHDDDIGNVMAGIGMNEPTTSMKRADEVLGDDEEVLTNCRRVSRAHTP